MKLVVGLGNPGPKYEITRHNAGFIVADLLADEFRLPFNDDHRMGGQLGRGELLNEPCVILKPMTFMNLSGRSVGAVARFFKIEAPDMIVLHDDIDVPSGRVRARVGGGHGGHNGIRSIMAETGLADFHRIKLGVGRPDVGLPEGAPGREMDVADWVLAPFSDEELRNLQDSMYKDVKQRLAGIFAGRRAAAN